MNRIAFNINIRDAKPQSVALVLDGKPVTLSSTHPGFNAIVKELKNPNPSVSVIRQNLNKKDALRGYSQNKITKIGDFFYYQGQKLGGPVVEKIYSLMRLGLPWKPSFLFLENLLKNPSANSRTLLDAFLTNEGLCLTPDGCFIGYKGAQKDFWSIHTGWHTMLKGEQSECGKLFYGTGEIIKVPREEVVEDPQQACARGIHVGSFKYANNWAGDDGVVVAVKVNPANVVSVPFNAKEVMRVNELEVVAHLATRQILTQGFEPQFDEDAMRHSMRFIRDAKGRFAKR